MIEKLRRELDRRMREKQARDDFIRYGQHLSWCAKLDGAVSCDCGYIDALGRQATAEFNTEMEWRRGL